VVKKKATKVKKKAVAKSSPAASVTKALRASIAALKQETRNLKNEFKAAAKRENVLARLEDQRDTAIAKFLDSWDKKAMAALGKSLNPRSEKKSRKK
jgi:methylthioribose-1-phosphate isomerase